MVLLPLSQEQAALLHRLLSIGRVHFENADDEKARVLQAKLVAAMAAAT